MKDVIIVGSGPAGLAAAIYAKRAGLDMLVVEKNYTSGGQVLTTYEVDNYPALPGINGFDLGMKMREHADGLGAEFVEAEVTEVVSEGAVKRVVTDNGTYEAAAVILAMGAHHAKLEVPEKKNFPEWGFPTVRPVTELFLRIRMWRSWAAAMWQSRMPSFWHGQAERSTSFTEGIPCARQNPCRRS